MHFLFATSNTNEFSQTLHYKELKSKYLGCLHSIHYFPSKTGASFGQVSKFLSYTGCCPIKLTNPLLEFLFLMIYLHSLA